MTQITLPEDVELAMADWARNRGSSVEQLAVEALRDRFVSPDAAGDQGETLADYLAGHIGVLSSSEYVPGGANLSVDCGKRFASALVEKQDQDSL